MQTFCKGLHWARKLPFNSTKNLESLQKLCFFSVKLYIFGIFYSMYFQRSSTSLILKVFSDSAPVLFIYLFLGVVSFFSLTFFLKFSFFCLQPSSYRPLQRFLFCFKFSISILSLF
jgi:hypothetical protein